MLSIFNSFIMISYLILEFLRNIFSFIFNLPSYTADMVCMRFITWDLLRFALWPHICSVFANVPINLKQWAPEALAHQGHTAPTLTYLSGSLLADCYRLWKIFLFKYPVQQYIKNTFQKYFIHQWLLRAKGFDESALCSNCGLVSCRQIYEYKDNI